MRQQRILCDVCGGEKGETNHWWTAYLFNTTDRSSYAEKGIKNVLQVTAWVKGDVPVGYENLEATYDLCGNRCLGIIVQRWTTGAVLDEKIPKEA